MGVRGYIPRRRFHSRFRTDVTITAVVEQNQKKSLIAKNLSVRGVGVVGNYSFKVGDAVTIIVQKPFFQECVEKKAKVIWCSKLEQNMWQAGLDFGLDNVIEFN